ncbi:DUF262 domain-containing protein [Bacillus atrophaeus]|uniref:DUF262 domain-containing protein n=1 Tax=Bacillus atrophaeus TaxID=1452 RepID=UPI000B455647|nr:DUF262 domain-containing protein [Bacillus atrophaeus]ARW05665.1 hypothetical protein S101359_00637 [Bacillus atrophaeus]
MSLQDEIDIKSKEIQTDSYSMSIGELMNMYKDNELQIQPDFQRFFRWTDAQKAKFIESILLGIPIPPIFVSQSRNGVWDVIDGLQRLSTIFEFTGILKDVEKKPVLPSVLKATRFLPSLKDKKWNDPEDEENSFAEEQRIDFKRAKLDINIIKKNSDADAKYELFQRLNTGGTSLTPQEIRNCLMIMLNKEFYTWVSDLRDFASFQNCLPLTDKQKIEQEDMEVVLRFLVYRHTDLDSINGNEDISDFLTEKMISIIEDDQFDYEQEKKVFMDTFAYLDENLGEDSFKRYVQDKNKFSGAFLISAFEAIIVGLSNNIEVLKESEEVVQKIKSIYEMNQFKNAIRPGTRAINRFKKLTILSKEVFGG